MTTLLVSHSASLDHDMGEGHPERPDRYRVVERALEAEAFQMLARDAAPRATREMLTRVHPREYVEAIEQATPAQRPGAARPGHLRCRRAPTRRRCAPPAARRSRSTR